MFIKTEIFKAISFRKPATLPLSYWLLVVARFVLTLLPQLGYIHPDEFFQNVEVIAGKGQSYLTKSNIRFFIYPVLIIYDL